MIYLRKGDTAATRMYCFPNGVELITIIQVGKAHNKIWPPELDYTYGSIIRSQLETIRYGAYQSILLWVRESMIPPPTGGCAMGVRNPLCELTACKNKHWGNVKHQSCNVKYVSQYL